MATLNCIKSVVYGKTIYYISKLYVESHLRKAGLATRKLNEFLSEVQRKQDTREENVRYVWLMADPFLVDGNDTSSAILNRNQLFAFYARRGFKRCGKSKYNMVLYPTRKKR